MGNNSEVTFTDEVSGVYYGQHYWDASDGSTSSKLLEKADSLTGLTLINADNFTSGYSDQVYVMKGGVLSNSTVIGGVLNVYSGGMISDITVGNEENVGHIMAYGGTLENITVKSGGLYLYSSSVVSGITISPESDFGTELTVNSGTILTGITVKTGSRLHVNPDYGSEEGGQFRNVTIEENSETVFFYQKVTGLTMEGDAVVEITNGTLSGRITATQSVPDAGHWLTLCDSTLDFNVSNVYPGTAPLVNNLSWIEIGSNVSYSLTVSDNQKNGTYKLAGGAAGFDQTLLVATDQNDIGALTVNGAGLDYGNYNFTLTTSEDSLLLTVRGGKGDNANFLIPGNVINFSGNLNTHTDQGSGSVNSIDSADWSLVGAGSFGSSGTTGLLWQENATGNVYVQNDVQDVSDLTAKSNLLGVVSEGYEIAGTGDFLGTGLDGALLLTPSFGDPSVSQNYGLAVWAREGSGDTVAGWLGALVNTWDDVEGMNGLKGACQSLVGEARNQVINSQNYRYELVGTADFNGDGKTDVMLRNNMPGIVDGETITGSGDVFIFLTDSHDNVLAGNRPAEGICYAGCATDGWNVVGFGDFNGDGTDDVLLSDGINLAGWQIENGQRVGYFWFGPLSGCNFLGSGDYNSDGSDDFLVSDPGSNYAVWTVNNGAISGSIAIA